MASSAEPDVGTALAGRYVLQAQIGTGGAGIVWRAHDAVLDRAVAVKLLHANLASDGANAARFRSEATAAARLTHPNAVVVFDIGRDGDRDYIVMELVDGPDLAELLKVERLEPGVVAHLGRAIAAALGTAHARNMVHRDVKPANVLLSREGVPKVADFGIARAIGAAMTRLTQPGSVMGTARYVAPEQLRDDHVDARADVYALGLLLHEALTGQVPWGEGTATEVAMRRLSGDHPPPSTVCHDVSPGLDAVVTRATRLEPDERYADGGEMAAALAPFVAADAPTWLATTVRELAGRPAEPGARQTSASHHGQAATDDAEHATVASARAPRKPTRQVAPPPAGTPQPMLPPPTGAPVVDADLPPPTRPAAQPVAPDASQPETARIPHDASTRASTRADGTRAATANSPAATPESPSTDTPEAAPLSPPPNRRRLWAVGAIALAVAVVVGILGVLDGGPTASDGGEPGQGQPDTSDLDIQDVGDHDPLGDEQERPDLLGDAVDDDDSTFWQSEGYFQADLIPPDKDGVGIWFDLGESFDIERIDLELVAEGSSFEIWAGEQPPDRSQRPDDWGTRHARVESADSSESVRLDDATGRVWLVWFTELPPDGNRYRARVADVRFRAR